MKPTLPTPLPPKPLPLRIQSRIAGARAVMGWERFAPAYLFAGLAVMLYLGAGFAGVWERIGDPWRLIGLVGTLGVVGWTVWQARGLRWPTRSRAKRRLEADNALSHRPLDTIEDSPRVTERGWAAHLRRAEDDTRDLRGPKLRPVMAERDGFFLRYAVPLLLVLGAVVGWGVNWERVRASLSPTWVAGVDPDAAVFEAWIDPPDYTGRRPVTLKTDALDDVPEGSEFVARISGVPSAPRLRLSDGRKVRPTRLGPESFEARVILDDDAEAKLRLGSREQVWSLRVIEDTLPTVQFADTPKADKRDRLALRYSLADDYGVETLALRMRPLVDAGEDVPALESLDVPLRNAPVAEAEDVLQPIDLSRHRWAGRKVVAELVVVDGLGQEAVSESAYFTVPNKIFVEPLAKAVVENRSLVLQGLEGGTYATEVRYDPNAISDDYQPGARLDRAPEDIQRAAMLLDAITEAPENAFDDVAVYMGLREAAYRIRYAEGVDELSGLDNDLWNIAIRAEFGRVGSALENMKRAQEQLNAAIARRAPQREIDTLFERYNEAVDVYMDALMEEAEIGEPVADGAPAGQGRNVDEIQELLDAIEEANRIGDTEGARLALARLAELLENMKIELNPGGGGGGQGEAPPGQMSDEMRDALEELAEAIGEQRDLRDDTERAQEGEEDGREGEDGEDGSQDGESGQTPGAQAEGQQPGGGGEGELSDRQEALRRGLADMRGAFPNAEAEGLGERGEEAGEALTDAEDAMGLAAELLEDGDLEGAQEQQDEAIRQLRSAGQGLAEALREQRDGEDGDEGEDGDGNPLGERNGGENDPDARSLLDGVDPAQRSREILEELRRRASEQERTQEERDYLERLMERF